LHFVTQKQELSRQFGSTTKHRLTKGELLFLFIAFLTAFAGAGSFSIIGFRACGWVWIITCLVSILLILLRRRRSLIFPYMMWIPFFIYIAFRSDFTYRPDVQRFFILLTPILTGIAISTLRIRNLETLRKAFYAILFITFLNYIAACVQSGSIKGFSSWNVPQGFCMTLVLTAIVGIVDWSYGNRRGLICLVASWLICLFTVSRMPILLIPFMVIIGPSNLSKSIRLLLVSCIIAVSFYSFFNLTSFRELIFRENMVATGQLDDVLELDKNVVNSSGRLWVWPYYFNAIKKRPIFGYGGTASSIFGKEKLKWASHPHNEYIRLFFDYGLVGFLLYAIPYGLLLKTCYKRFLHVSSEIKWLYAVGAGGLLGGIILGITGNVLMYVAWYGNLLFATIGVAFRLYHEKYSCNKHYEPIFRHRKVVF
jgi:O-antigen ligase